MQERMNIIQAITARVEIALVPVAVTRVIRVGALVMIVTVIQKIAKASKKSGTKSSKYAIFDQKKWPAYAFRKFGFWDIIAV